MTDYDTIISILDKANVSHIAFRSSDTKMVIEVDSGRNIYFEFSSPGTLETVWTPDPDNWEELAS